MDPRGHESDPVAFMRPDGDPKTTRSPHAYFHQIFFRGGGTLPAPGALARRRVLLRLGRSFRLGNLQGVVALVLPAISAGPHVRRRAAGSPRRRCGDIRS